MTAARPPVPPALVAMALIATVVLLSLPIVLTPVPAIGDYVNHLARMHILAAYAASPELQANYLIRWLPSPYLAMDLVIPALARFMSIYAAGQVFLVATLALWMLGCCAIHYALFRRLSPWPLTAALVAYNFDFNLGFVNYLFGAGVWLLVLAAWIGTAGWRGARRVPLFVLLCLPVYFSHYAALLGYAVTVAGYEFGQWWSKPPRRFAALAARGVAVGGQFLIPFALVVGIAGGQPAALTRYGGIAEKLAAFLSPARFIDSPFALPILLFLVLVLNGGFSLRVLRMSPAMRFPLALLALVSLAMPNALAGVWGTDLRFPPVLVVLLIASCEFDAARLRIERAVVLASTCLLIGHLASIAQAWRLPAARYAEFRSALPAVARGARLLVFLDAPGVDARIPERANYYQHMASLAVIDRDVFLPTLFKNPLLPVEASAGNRIIDTEHTGPPISVAELWDGADAVKGPAMLGQIQADSGRNYWGDWPAHFDYAIGLNVAAATPLPPELRPIRAGSFFTIYRVVERQAVAARTETHTP